YASTHATTTPELRVAAARVIVRKEDIALVLRLRRRPGEARACRESLECVVGGVGAGARQAHMEVEGVRVAARGERAEARGTEAGERSVVDRRAAVSILVDRELELAGERCAARGRSGQRVRTGESAGVRDRDRARRGVADLHRREREDRAGTRAAHRQRTRRKCVGRDRRRRGREVRKGPTDGADRDDRYGRRAEQELLEGELLEHFA